MAVGGGGLLCSLSMVQRAQADMAALLLSGQVALSCPSFSGRLPRRFRECISDQHYIPSLLAMYGLDNEVNGCWLGCCILVVGQLLDVNLCMDGRFCAPQLPPQGESTCHARPALLCCSAQCADGRLSTQTSCDPSGGTYERWVHGRALGETATDRAGRAQDEAQGGHFQLYQPGHVSAGEACWLGLCGTSGMLCLTADTFPGCCCRCKAGFGCRRCCCLTCSMCD